MDTNTQCFVLYAYLELDMKFEVSISMKILLYELKT